MSPVSPAIDKALASLRAMLEADDYHLVLVEEGANVLVAEIAAGPSACADCLVPKELMRCHFESALRKVVEFGMPEIRLIYPGDH
jgi:hypothetical protein